MIKTLPIYFTALAVQSLILAPAAAQYADDPDMTQAVLKGRPYSPYADRAYPTDVYFGDTHVHTGLSADAGGSGTRLMPRDAYRFARGEQVISNTGQPVKLARPYDFFMITDHSDAMGAITDIIDGAPNILADPEGRKFHEDFNAGGQTAAQAMFRLINQFAQGEISPELNYQPGNPAYERVWDDIVRAAEEFNDPGTFTTFIAFEWTSLVSGNNLHRNVIFRDGAERAGQVVPYTTTPPIGSRNPRDLWAWLANYEEKTGGDVTAIPHNGNLSNGMMFAMQDDFADGAPLDRAYAEERAKWERLYEVTQLKGDGEAHPLLSPEDEFADYETWDFGNLDGTQAKTAEMLPGEYARSGLLRGLQLEASLGVNPFKFGLEGATDTHTGLSTIDEDNFFGKFTTYEPSPERAAHAGKPSPAGITMPGGGDYSAAGVTAVWATENTRGALFDAMERREVYATTGPRMRVRFFGGWGFEPGRRIAPRPGPDRIHQGRAHGRGPAGPVRRGQGPDLPGLRPQRPHRRQPGPHPDHQGLAGRRRQPTGEGLRRRLVGRPPAGRRRQAPAGRRHRGSVGAQLDQHHRRLRARHGLERPGLRPPAAGLLLRPGDRDPHPALDRLRPGEVQARPADRDPAQDPGAGLYLADLVYAVIRLRSTRHPCIDVIAERRTR